MIQELHENANRYPESLCYDLRLKLAESHHLTPEHFLLENGEDGAITILGLTFLNPGEEVLAGQVTFAAYENMADKMDGVYVKVPLTSDYRLDVDGFLAAITPKTKLLFLCNPNNPTGTINTQEEFDRLIKRLPERVILVVDEAYCHFADDRARDGRAYPQTTPYLRDYPNLVILRTFSKIMGLAGLRVGYAIAQPEVVKLMLKAREPFPVNRIAQAGALAALDDADFVRRTLEVNRRGREQFYRAFDGMELRYCHSQANFIFIDLGRPVQPVFEALLREGVIVRPLTSFGLADGLRISVGMEEENARTIAALKKVLACI